MEKARAIIVMVIAYSFSIIAMGNVYDIIMFIILSCLTDLGERIAVLGRNSFSFDDIDKYYSIPIIGNIIICLDTSHVGIFIQYIHDHMFFLWSHPDMTDETEISFIDIQIYHVYKVK